MSDISGKLSENKDLSATISPKGGTLSASLMSGRGVGHGIPAGGTTGQALVKASNDDYDAAWKSLDSGDVAYSDSETYGDGTVGKEVSDLKSALTDMYPTDTASGAIASFPDGAKDVPVDSLIVNIEPVQEGTGDPSPDNIRPISGHEEVSVVRCGKNLLPIQTLKKGGNTYYIGDGSTYFFFKAGTYTASNVGTAAYMYWRKKGTTNNNVIHGGNATSGTFTITEDCEVMFWFYSTVAGASFTNIQLEVGSTATAYEPYQGETYTIELGDTIYGGVLDVTKGELTVDRAMVDLGTLTWATTETDLTEKKRIYSTSLQNVIQHASANNVLMDIVCEVYKARTADETYLRNQGISVNTSGYVLVYDENYSDGQTATVNAFKTSVSGKYLCYPLASPIIIPLTPQQISTLYGTNNFFADTGDTNVTYKADIQLYIQKKISAAVAALS